MSRRPWSLTVAGTDSGRSRRAWRPTWPRSRPSACHGACVVTAVTAQDTTGVHAMHPVPLDVVAAQLDAVLDDLPVAVGQDRDARHRRRWSRLVADRLRPACRSSSTRCWSPPAARSSATRRWSRLRRAPAAACHRRHAQPRRGPRAHRPRRTARRPRRAAGRPRRAVVLTGGRAGRRHAAPTGSPSPADAATRSPSGRRDDQRPRHRLHVQQRPGRPPRPRRRPAAEAGRARARRTTSPPAHPQPHLGPRPRPRARSPTPPPITPEETS